MRSPFKHPARVTVGLLLTMFLFGLSSCLDDNVQVHLLDDDDDDTADDDDASDSDDPSDDDDSTPPDPDLAECGNDILEEGEECDGSPGLAGEACLSDCTLDRSVYCPDGTITHRMPHNDSIWKENNTFLARGFNEEDLETRTFCVDLVLSDGDSVYLQAVHQWGEEFRTGPMRASFEQPRWAVMRMDVTPPPGSAATARTNQDESPLVEYEAAATPSSGVWRVHLRDWSAEIDVGPFSKEEAPYDILVQVVEAGIPFDASQGVERAPVCGDGEIHLGAGEQCDDANTDEDDGCRSDCTIDTEMMCPAGVLDMIFDDPMYGPWSGDNVPGVYGNEHRLDHPGQTQVHCVPVPHDTAIQKLTMYAYEDCEAGVPGTLVVTPPAGSGATSVTDQTDTGQVIAPKLRYGRSFSNQLLSFNNTQGGVWLHSLTGWTGMSSSPPRQHDYWEFKWSVH